MFLFVSPTLKHRKALNITGISTPNGVWHYISNRQTVVGGDGGITQLHFNISPKDKPYLGDRPFVYTASIFI